MKRLVGLSFALPAAVVGLGLWHPWTRHEVQPGAVVRSIAVLPFDNLGVHDDDYLADAVTDDLATDLGRLPGTFVISRRSTEQYRTHHTTPEAAARALAVRYLVLGDIRNAQEQLSIDAYLIDSQTGAYVLTERQKRPLGEMQAVQAALARHVAGALTLPLDEDWRSAAERHVEQGVLDRFLAARAVLERDPPADALRTAQPLLETSVAVAPELLEAIDLLARMLLAKVELTGDRDRDDDLADAGRWIARALAHAPDDGAARANKGRLLMLSGQHAEAIASFRAALRAEPGDVELRDWLATSLSRVGHPEEAPGLIREAMVLSPKDPDMAGMQARLGDALLLAGQPEEAERQFRLAAEDRSAPSDHDEIGLIEALSIEGRNEEARNRLAAFDKSRPHRTAWREACRLSRAEANLPVAAKIVSGLIAAGMPDYASETVDDGIEPGTAAPVGDDFAPTPVRAPGALTILGSELAQQLQRPSPPVVIDIGCGGAVIPQAVFLPGIEDAGDIGERVVAAMAARAAGDKTRPVVVMGSGVYGLGSYRATLALAAAGYSKVFWFRGGEEAWAAARRPADDRRDP